MAEPKKDVPPIGLLTCLPRDQWADLYNVLQQGLILLFRMSMGQIVQLLTWMLRFREQTSVGSHTEVHHIAGHRRRSNGRWFLARSSDTFNGIRITCRGSQKQRCQQMVRQATGMRTHLSAFSEPSIIFSVEIDDLLMSGSTSSTIGKVLEQSWNIPSWMATPPCGSCSRPRKKCMYFTFLFLLHVHLFY